MRILGSVLIGFGTFCLVVAAVAALDPALRSHGIDLVARTTSAVGTGIMGALSLVAGALLRRRDTEARRARELAGVSVDGARALAGPAASERPAAPQPTVRQRHS